MDLVVRIFSGLLRAVRLGKVNFDGMRHVELALRNRPFLPPPVSLNDAVAVLEVVDKEAVEVVIVDAPLNASIMTPLYLTLFNPGLLHQNLPQFLDAS